MRENLDLFVIAQVRFILRNNIHERHSKEKKTFDENCYSNKRRKFFLHNDHNVNNLSLIYLFI